MSDNPLSDSHRHDAIYALYSDAAGINGKDGTFTVVDSNGDSVSIDMASVEAKAVELHTAELLDELRAERNKRLAETDHYGLSDQSMSTEMSTYRQNLRDITDTYSTLDTVVWPTKP